MVQQLCAKVGPRLVSDLRRDDPVRMLAIRASILETLSAVAEVITRPIDSGRVMWEEDRRLLTIWAKGVLFGRDIPTLFSTICEELGHVHNLRQRKRFNFLCLYDADVQDCEAFRKYTQCLSEGMTQQGRWTPSDIMMDSELRGQYDTELTNRTEIYFERENWRSGRGGVLVMVTPYRSGSIYTEVRITPGGSNVRISQVRRITLEEAEGMRWWTTKVKLDSRQVHNSLIY